MNNIYQSLLEQSKAKKMPCFRLSLFFSFLLLSLHPSKGDERCRAECGTVPIRFPFQMSNSSLPESRCGYPGFTVTCENETQNILIFPHSGEFRIASINYSSQLIWISDPRNCTPRRLLQGFNHSDTRFQPLYTRNFAFLNCTFDAPVFETGVSQIPCLSSDSYSVVALPTGRYNVSNISRCKEIARFLYPSSGADDSSDFLFDSIMLTWKEPDCQRCESAGADCQFTDNMGLDVGCFKRLDPVFPAKVRHVLFVVASGLWILGLIIYLQRKVMNRSRNQPDADSTHTPQLNNVVAKGLDRPTIEMYPTTLLDENMQLPKPTDNICPICLLQYQAKEVLRTIPSCMHYFHADCIDEWLKRNATCPLCRC